jgi:hypothetical protein
LTVAPDGSVYAADPNSGAIYRAGAGEGRVTAAFPAGEFNSPQGMAPSQDGDRLYVSDYGLGIFVVDLRLRTKTLLSSRLPEMLDGIDGLVRHGGDLIAIQNGTEPRRILRLVLDRSGNIVDRVIVLERAVRSWGEPTLATLRGDTLIYVDSQSERFGENGIVRGSDPLRPTAIRALRLR